MQESEFQPGDLVAYIPYHAKGNIRHQDVEYGTVSSKRIIEDKEIVFVRFGAMQNSQGCSPDQLRKVI